MPLTTTMQPDVAFGAATLAAAIGTGKKNYDFLPAVKIGRVTAY